MPVPQQYPPLQGWHFMMITWSAKCFDIQSEWQSTLNNLSYIIHETHKVKLYSYERNDRSCLSTDTPGTGISFFKTIWVPIRILANGAKLTTSSAPLTRKTVHTFCFLFRTTGVGSLIISALWKYLERPFGCPYLLQCNDCRLLWFIAHCGRALYCTYVTPSENNLHFKQG